MCICIYIYTHFRIYVYMFCTQNVQSVNSKCVNATTLPSGTAPQSKGQFIVLLVGVPMSIYIYTHINVSVYVHIYELLFLVYV